MISSSSPYNDLDAYFIVRRIGYSSYITGIRTMEKELIQRILRLHFCSQSRGKSRAIEIK